MYDDGDDDTNNNNNHNICIVKYDMNVKWSVN